MTSAISVKSIKNDQAVLQKAYEQEKSKFEAAKARFMTAKNTLCAFNDKYGRVIAMMEYDQTEE